jgi:hypothetical protein
MRNNERIVDAVDDALFWVFVCCPLWKVALPTLVGQPASLQALPFQVSQPLYSQHRCFIRSTDAVVQLIYAYAGSTDLISSINDPSRGAGNHSISPCTFGMADVNTSRGSSLLLHCAYRLRFAADTSTAVSNIRHLVVTVHRHHMSVW